MWGVDPDIEVRHYPKERSETLAMRRRADIIRYGEEDQPDDAQEADEDEVEATDAQLDLALLMMRMRLTGYNDWPFAPETKVAVETTSSERDAHQRTMVSPN